VARAGRVRAYRNCNTTVPVCRPRIAALSLQSFLRSVDQLAAEVGVLGGKVEQPVPLSS
jgi:hypothetical protein